MIDLKDIQRRMDGAVEALKREFNGLRTGRANPQLLEGITVQVYGAEMPLQQVGTVTASAARTLSVNVWDQGIVKSVEKAIVEAELGLNPQTDGQTLRINLPELTQERRRELVKVGSRFTEQARVAVRNLRREAMDGLKRSEKAGEISQDLMHKEGNSVQKMTDNKIEEIDALFAQKEKDIVDG